MSPEGNREQTELLVELLRGRGSVLEIGVGTGQVALALAAAGVSMTGVDIAESMLRVLVEKSGGTVPFPLVRADATRAPFRDGSFGGVVIRWVLHLIPTWRLVLEELVRTLGPGGVALIQLGGYGPGPQGEIRDRFNELLGIANEPVGIMWGDVDALDGVMVGLGAVPRALRVITDVDTQPLDTFIEGIEQGSYSWTWRVPDEKLSRVTAEVRVWAERRFGPLDRTPPHPYEVEWRAYDLA
jgi:SAM-dependent methyltransferase